MKIWNGIDDLDFYVDTMVVPEEAEKFTRIYRINAFRVKANDLDMDADDIYGKENKEIRDEPKEIPLDKLLLDGVDIEFPGDECILKGIRRPGDNTRRYIATRKANAKALNGAITIGTHVTINRGENGNTSPKNREEWLKTTVAAKKKPKSDCSNYFNKADRRKTRHEGKTECRAYVPEDTTFDLLNGLDLRGKILAFADSDSKELREKLERYEYLEIFYYLFLSAVDCVKEIRGANFSKAKLLTMQEWDDVCGVSTGIYSLGVFNDAVNAVEAFLDGFIEVIDENSLNEVKTVNVCITPTNGKHMVGSACCLY